MGCAFAAAIGPALKVLVLAPSVIGVLPKELVQSPRVGKLLRSMLKLYFKAVVINGLKQMATGMTALLVRLPEGAAAKYRLWSTAVGLVIH